MKLRFRTPRKRKNSKSSIKDNSSDRKSKNVEGRNTVNIPKSTAKCINTMDYSTATNPTNQIAYGNEKDTKLCKTSRMGCDLENEVNSSQTISPVNVKLDGKKNENLESLLKPCQVIIERCDIKSRSSKGQTAGKKILHSGLELSMISNTRSACEKYSLRMLKEKPSCICCTQSKTTNSKSVQGSKNENAERLVVTSTPIEPKRNRRSSKSKSSFPCTPLNTKYRLENCKVDSILRKSFPNDQSKRGCISVSKSGEILSSLLEDSSETKRSKRLLAKQNLKVSDETLKLKPKHSQRKANDPSSTPKINLTLRSGTFEGIPIDDLALAAKPNLKRKAKSDGYKVPSKNTIKRKRFVMKELNQANENHEDDIYESKEFDFMKNLFEDTTCEPSGLSVMQTPKLGIPVTPMIRKRTPQVREVISPTDYALERKLAEEVLYRRTKRTRSALSTSSSLNRVSSKTKPDFSTVVADALKKEKEIHQIMQCSESDDSISD